MEAKHEFDFMQITENEFNLRMRQLNSKNVKPNAYKFLIITNLFLTVSLIVAVTFLYLNEFAVIHNHSFFGFIFSKKESEASKSNASYLQTNETFTTQATESLPINSEYLRQIESNVTSLRQSLDESIANLSVHLNGKFDAHNEDLINDLQNIELRLYAYENASEAIKSQLESAVNAIVVTQKQLETKQSHLFNFYGIMMNNSDENMHKIGEYVTALNTKLTKLEYELNNMKSAQLNATWQLKSELETNTKNSSQSFDEITANHAEVNYLTNVTEFLISSLYSRFTCKNELTAGSTKVSLNIDYKSNSDCFYVIRSKAKRIQYWVDSFETEECCDFLRIVDGNDVLDIRGQDKTLTRRRTSKWNFVYMYFHSDQSVEKSPIIIRFSEV